MNFRNKVAQFMFGRYGNDKLNIALLVLYFILMVVNLFVRTFILNILELLVVLAIFYRMLSRDIPRRRAENAKFEKQYNKVKPFFVRTGNRVKEIKTHRYRKCPHCKVFLRLPRKVGKHNVVCPRCKTRFAVRVLF